MPPRERCASKAANEDCKIGRAKPKVQKVIALDQDELLGICGEQDWKLKKIQATLKARIIARGNEIRIGGTEQEVETAHAMISDLIAARRDNGVELSDSQFDRALREGREAPPGHVRKLLTDTIEVPLRGARITPLTRGQQRYIEAIRQKDIVVSVGPAGTGKTYLAVAMAVEALQSNRVRRIVLVRPIIEAGERLGFLPGDIAQKVDPYVRPLYDALYEMMEAERIRQLTDEGAIEIAPLAFMRGRTLDHSFVILDEAQNTSVEQMKMFLTRMGQGSKMVINGDTTQIDLPGRKQSGLIQALKILKGIEGIELIMLTRRDVVRHELVEKIVMAYEAYGKKS